MEIYLVSTPDMFNCLGEVNGHGEGGLFLGALRVVLNEFSGVISFSRDNQMNTSEFSQNYPLPSPLNFGDELLLRELIYRGKFEGFKGKAGIYFIKTRGKTFKVVIQP
ncbi:MAG: hypothetical protein ABIL23_07070 [candidate division WOR-3 bacterium]